MFSPRGVMMLCHNVHDVQVFKRHVHANRLNGVDNAWLEPAEAKSFCPPLNIGGLTPATRSWAPRCSGPGGTARHDAVAWGYARAASALGVDIIEQCEVTGIRRAATGEVAGVDTSRGFIGAKQGGGGRRRQHQRRHGHGRRPRMPLESHPLQALVSEPVKPCFPCVVMSNTVHAYLSASPTRASW